MLRSFVCIVALGMAAVPAEAALVKVTINGVVDYNVIGGNQTGIPSGAPVQMSFKVDSDVFVNSPNFPTRGYQVILDSFSLTVGGQPIHIANPQPGGVPLYFVLRDNDPAVDGFFLSRGNVNLPFAAGANVPGIAQPHDLDFLVTYGNSTTLSSLNILDAVGDYGFSGISSYLWTVGAFGGIGAEYVYQGMTISSCLADINGDSTVNVVDLLAVINGWGACGNPCPADINADDQVNVIDLLAVINAWGACN